MKLPNTPELPQQQIEISNYKEGNYKEIQSPCMCEAEVNVCCCSFMWRLRQAKPAHHILGFSPVAHLRGSFSPFHTMSCFVPAQLPVNPSELGLLAKVDFTRVCALAEGMRDHMGCFCMKRGGCLWWRSREQQGWGRGRATPFSGSLSLKCSWDCCVS